MNRRLAKYLPLSPEMGAAIEMDLRGETGKITSTSTIIDSPASVAADMQERTEAQLEELRKRMGPDASSGEAPASSAPARAEPAPAPGNGSDSQPW